jgi:hypothetical protein
MEPLFPLDDTPALLQSSLQRWLQDNAPFDRRAALLATPAAFQPLPHRAQVHGVPDDGEVVGDAQLGGLHGRVEDARVDGRVEQPHEQRPEPALERLGAQRVQK